MIKNDPQIYMNIKFNNEEVALPINPEKLSINRTATNDNINIIGLGPATRKGHPGLITMKISSFFPHFRSNYNYFGKTPEYYINFINNIWESDNVNNKVATLTTIGITPQIKDMPFVIDNFDYEHRGGDFDIYYNLSIKQYVPYGAKEKIISSAGTKSARIESTNVTYSKTYTVKSGDTLSSITKTCTGGTGSWQALYELNKVVIGSDPDVIRVGQVLTLPEDWSAPVKNTATKTTTTKKQTTTKKTVKTTETVATATNEVAASVYEKTTYTDGSSEVTAKTAVVPRTDIKDLDIEWASFVTEYQNYINYSAYVGTIVIQNWKDGKEYKPYVEDSDLYTKRLQDTYNKAVKIATNTKKSEKERAEALRTLRKTELQFMHRVESSIANYVKTFDKDKKIDAYNPSKTYIRPMK